MTQIHDNYRQAVQAYAQQISAEDSFLVRICQQEASNSHKQRIVSFMSQEGKKSHTRNSRRKKRLLRIICSFVLILTDIPLVDWGFFFCAVVKFSKFVRARVEGSQSLMESAAQTILAQPQQQHGHPRVDLQRLAVSTDGLQDISVTPASPGDDRAHFIGDDAPPPEHARRTVSMTSNSPRTFLEASNMRRPSTSINPFPAFVQTISSASTPFPPTPSALNRFPLLVEAMAELNEIFEASGKIKVLMHNAVSLSQLETGNFVFRCHPFMLSDVCERIQDHSAHRTGSSTASASAPTVSFCLFVLFCCQGFPIRVSHPFFQLDFFFLPFFSSATSRPGPSLTSKPRCW
jgi:hypothetical protein